METKERSNWLYYRVKNSEENAEVATLFVFGLYGVIILVMLSLVPSPEESGDTDKHQWVEMIPGWMILVLVILGILAFVISSSFWKSAKKAEKELEEAGG